MRLVGEKRRKDFAFIRSPLRQVKDYLDESAKLSAVYSTGVGRLQNAHDRAKWLEEVRDLLGKDDGLTADERGAWLEREKELETLAKDEVSSGYRLLSAHAILSVWGVMESTVDGWVVEWLKRRPQDLCIEADAEIKLPAAAYVSLSVDERAEILFTALRKKQGQSFGTGVARFERPLAIVGLSGPTPEFLSDGIYEMHKVRNVYAHCAGRADQAFLDGCPWFDLSIGEIVPVNQQMLMGYENLLALYVLSLLHRGFARVGIRLVGEGAGTPYWDRSIDVVNASIEAEAEYCHTYPPSLGALPIIRAKHSSLLEAGGSNGGSACRTSTS